MSVAYEMNELALNHQRLIDQFFRKNLAANKWDNTGRAQDPDGKFPPACIWRHAWEDWRTNQMVVKRNQDTVSSPGSALPVAPPKGAPLCPIHGGRMRYDGSKNTFVCPEADCTLKATPKNKADELKDSVLKGGFELIHIGSADRYLVRHLPTGAIIDFGDQLQPIGTGELHAQDGQYVMLVQFEGQRTISSEEYNIDD